MTRFPVQCAVLRSSCPELYYFSAVDVIEARLFFLVRALFRGKFRRGVVRDFSGAIEKWGRGAAGLTPNSGPKDPASLITFVKALLIIFTPYPLTSSCISYYLLYWSAGSEAPEFKAARSSTYQCQETVQLDAYRLLVSGTEDAGRHRTA
jgi:hypothetical protein